MLHETHAVAESLGHCGVNPVSELQITPNSHPLQQLQHYAGPAIGVSGSQRDVCSPSQRLLCKRCRTPQGRGGGGAHVVGSGHGPFGLLWPFRPAVAAYSLVAPQAAGQSREAPRLILHRLLGGHRFDPTTLAATRWCSCRVRGRQLAVACELTLSLSPFSSSIH